MTGIGFLIIIIVLVGILFSSTNTSQKTEVYSKEEQQKKLEELEEIAKIHQDRLNDIVNKYQETISSDENIKMNLQELQDYIDNSFREIKTNDNAYLHYENLFEKIKTWPHSLNTFEYLCLCSKYKSATNEEVKEFEREKNILKAQSQLDALLEVSNYLIGDNETYCTLSIINNSLCHIDSIDIAFKAYMFGNVSGGTVVHETLLLNPGEKYKKSLSLCIAGNTIKLESFHFNFKEDYNIF